MILLVGIFNGGSYLYMSRLILEGILVAIGWLVWWKFNAINNYIKVTPLIIVVIALMIISGLTLTKAVNIEAALENFTMYGATVIFVVLITNLENHSNEIIFQILYSAIVMIAAICLVNACCLPIADWYLSEAASNVLRISGPFHYANTMGAILSAFWLSGPYLISKVTCFSERKYLFALMQILLLAALILTLSRASYLVTLVGIVYYLFSAGFNKAWEALGLSIIGGFFVASMTSFYHLPGLIFAIGFFYLIVPSLFDYVSRWSFTSRWKYIVGIGFLLSAIFLMSSFTARISSITLDFIMENNRLAYWRTAYRIIKDHPWGIGGGGWIDLYPQYQNFAFFAREVHSGYLQMVLELGLPVFVLLATGLIMAIYGLVKLRSRGQIAQMPYPLIAAALVLLIHAGMDFDWSFMSVWLITLFMVHISFKGLVDREVFRFRRWRPVIGIVFGTLTLLIVMQYGSASLAQAGFNRLKGDPFGALVLLNRAVTINPFSADNRIGLAQAMQAGPNEKRLMPGDVLYSGYNQQLEKAVQLRPASAEIYATIGERFLSLGQPQAAWPYLYRSAELAPCQLRRYQKAAEAALLLGESELAENNPEAVQWLAKPPELYQNVQIMAAKQPYYIGKLERIPMHDALMGLMTGKAQCYLGNYKAAKDAFKDAENNPALCTEARAWIIMVRAKENGLISAEAIILAEGEGMGGDSFTELWKYTYPLLGKAAIKHE